MKTRYGIKLERENKTAGERNDEESESRRGLRPQAGDCDIVHIMLSWSFSFCPFSSHHNLVGVNKGRVVMVVMVVIRRMVMLHRRMQSQPKIASSYLVTIIRPPIWATPKSAR